MVALEYIIAQHQDGLVSVAVNSKKVRQQNPAIIITLENGNYVFRLRGLHIGDVEQVTGQARATRLDFYIGMDDLHEQRTSFPRTRARSLGLANGLRIPVGTERVGGKKIKWRGPLSRIQAEDISMNLPPYTLRKNPQSDVMLNIDKESSPYPITSDGGNQTIRELHFGIEHDYVIKQSGRIKIPRITFVLNPRQYATFLEAIDSAIAQHQNP